jgi:hypothetical protein
MNRRDFLKASAVMAAGAAVPVSSVAAEAGASAGAAPSKLIISAPMLQNHAETSVGVAFAVSALANGYVEYSLSPDMSNAVKVKCGGFRVTDMNDKVMLVRLRGLKPATKYYYRIGADRISYKSGYAMKIVGTEIDPKVYSFTTAGEKAKGHFAVINDTHAQWEPFSMVLSKIDEIDPPCVVWNGDATNCEETIDRHVKIFLDPDVERKDYASCRPYSLAIGNHEFRGMAGRHLERAWMFRDAEERLGRDWDLGRNFAVRQGDIAMIGLDTAEDKLDSRDVFAGLFCSEPYREAQAKWLEEALERPEIKSAPYLVAFCHIPLFDPRPDANPGDLRPNDKAPGYKADYAAWQRTCANLWGPLLDRAGCQLVITAHQHHYRYDAPVAGRGWAQIVGGGPECGFRGRTPDAGLFPTVIEGKVENDALRIIVHNAFLGTVAGDFTFAPRA